MTANRLGLAILLLFGSAEPPILQAGVQKLVPHDGADQDRFGRGVAVDGDIIVIGAAYDDDLGTSSGSAYVFERDGFGVWAFSQKLTAATGAPSDFFGEDVDIQNNTLVVGAEQHGKGAVFVFERSPSGPWQEVATLEPTDPQNGGDFGQTVEIDGGVLAVGRSGFANKMGAVHVFERDPTGSWVGVARLQASDGQARDLLGDAIAVSNDVVVAGAWEANSGSGSAYVFRRDPSTGTWQEEQKLVAPGPPDWDQFGVSVDVDGDLILVGAISEESTEADTGAAYVFAYDSALQSWSQEAKLIAEDTRAGSEFGSAVALDGGRALVGAAPGDGCDLTSGAAYLFQRDPVGRDWALMEKRQAFDGQSDDGFGLSLDLDEGTMVVGASGHSYLSVGSGAVYVNPPVVNIAPYGFGCGGSGGLIPRLSITGCPVAGGLLNIYAACALGGATGILFASSSSRQVPLGGGCSLFPISILAAFPFGFGGAGAGGG
ncbi:MAG: hypothetical protein DWP92_08385, partial [Armatimonadetes bacterium]